jgi:outer membrane protein assembly factor BamE (lipoprotein component of BamABCDE complex)
MTRTIHAARASAVVLLATTLGACATKLGRDFDDAYAQQIKPGVTTKAEIRGRLGAPAQVQATADHDHDTWTYGYYSGGGLFRNWWTFDPINPMGAQQKRLVITFKGDTVTEARFTQEWPPPNQLEEAYR